jgi:hypothetical protein
MMGRIGCKDCISTKCEGCNMLTLERMLNSGKFDCLMDEPHCIDQNAEVGVVKHAQWIGVQNGCGCCSNCHRQDRIDPIATHCRYCGAKMDGKSCVPRTEDGGAESE